MNNIHIILKVTDACNLRCKYCYNSDSQYGGEVLSLERLKKFWTILAAKYNAIDIVWHGGEPLSAGVAYMEEAMRLQSALHVDTGIRFTNEVQTNGTLIDAEWVSFFKRHHWGVGISFDGIQNDKYRQQGEKTLRGMRLLRDAGLRFGVLAVVADADYDVLANYRYFADMHVPVDFSPVFCEGAAKGIASLPVEKYSEDMVRLFDTWLYDRDGVSVRVFNSYIAMLLNSNMRVCTHGSCLGKYLSISANGNVYNCGRESVKAYPFGHIDDVNSVDDLFGSEGFRALLLGSIQRRAQCKASCEWFERCCGNCADAALTEQGLSTPPPEACHQFRTVFGHVQQVFTRLMDEKVPLEQLNPSIKTTYAKCFAVSGDAD